MMVNIAIRHEHLKLLDRDREALYIQRNVLSMNLNRIALDAI
jgi:hypothetical protein